MPLRLEAIRQTYIAGKHRLPGTVLKVVIYGESSGTNTEAHGFSNVITSLFKNASMKNGYTSMIVESSFRKAIALAGSQKESKTWLSSFMNCKVTNCIFCGTTTPRYWKYEGNDTMTYQMKGYDGRLAYYNGEITRTVLYANNETTCLLVRDDLWWLYGEDGKKVQEAKYNRTKNGRNKPDGERYSCKKSKPDMPKEYLCNSRPFYELFVAGSARHKVRQECTEKYEQLRGPRPAYCRSYVRGC